MKSLQDEGHSCRGWRSPAVPWWLHAHEPRWHLWLVQGSAGTVTGQAEWGLEQPALVKGIPVPGALQWDDLALAHPFCLPWVHQLHAALSICVPEVQQVCFMPCRAPTWKILPLKLILLTHAIFFRLWKKQTEKKHSFWSFGYSNLSMLVSHYWLYQFSLDTTSVFYLTNVWCHEVRSFSSICFSTSYFIYILCFVKCLTAYLVNLGIYWIYCYFKA